MANPKLENGYTRIANELLEAMCRLNISSLEMRILLYIIRKTYGYNKKSVEISLLDLADFFGMKKNNVSRTLKKLAELNLIEIQPNQGTKPQIISVVKDYDSWNAESYQNQQLSKLITVIKNDNPTVIKNDNPTVITADNPTVINADNPTYKENKKENIKEIIKESEREPRPNKKTFGSNQNVRLTDSEYQDLKQEFGKKLRDDYIQKLDYHIAEKGNRFHSNSHYATICKWIHQDYDSDKIKRMAKLDEYSFVINKF